MPTKPAEARLNPSEYVRSRWRQSALADLGWIAVGFGLWRRRRDKPMATAAQFPLRPHATPAGVARSMERGRGEVQFVWSSAWMQGSFFCARMRNKCSDFFPCFLLCSLCTGRAAAAIVCAWNKCSAEGRTATQRRKAQRNAEKCNCKECRGEGLMAGKWDGVAGTDGGLGGAARRVGRWRR